jgi:hypothetical protein
MVSRALYSLYTEMAVLAFDKYETLSHSITLILEEMWLRMGMIVKGTKDDFGKAALVSYFMMLSVSTASHDRMTDTLE